MQGLKELGAFGLQVPTELGGVGLCNTQVRQPCHFPVSPSAPALPFGPFLTTRVKFSAKQLSWVLLDDSPNV